MSTVKKTVDQFNTTKDEISILTTKIQSNNVWFKLVDEYYPKELQMLFQCIKDSCSSHAPPMSFSICNVPKITMKIFISISGKITVSWNHPNKNQSFTKHCSQK